jgi:3-hydroxyisobutyrate dehydrogenase-like beta-hydroxyacid dehydrogenase
MKTVGVIGLGNMGMAKNFIKKGFPTKDYDVFAPKLEQFSEAGGISCASPAEVGKDTDVVFVMVLNGQQALDVAIAREMVQAGFVRFPDEDNWAVTKILEDIAQVEVERR